MSRQRTKEGDVLYLNNKILRNWTAFEILLASHGVVVMTS